VLALQLAILAFSASAPRLELVETRVNLMGGYAIEGQSVLLEHDWIYRKPLLSPAPTVYRPALGLYGSWTRDNEERYRPGQVLAFGTSTKVWALPDHSGANGYFAARLGMAYEIAGEGGARGFGEEDFDWVDYGISVGGNLGRIHGLHPVLEFYMSATQPDMGARVGLSLPLVHRIPLPPPPARADPSDPDPRRPLFHAALGAVFTTEDMSLPIIGEKWFGGQMDAGISIYRSVRRQVILGTRVLAAGASPADAWNQSRPGLVSAALTLAYQDLQVDGSGFGYRVTAGGRYHTRYRDRYGYAGDLMPVMAVMILVPTRSGCYPFLEVGGFSDNPAVVGVGMSL
jgi:hypothetical protein